MACARWSGACARLPAPRPDRCARSRAAHHESSPARRCLTPTGCARAKLPEEAAAGKNMQDFPLHGRRCRRRLLSIGSLALLLGSCATPPANTAKAPPQEPAVVDALYAGIDIAVKRYGEGLRLLGEGERDQGMAEMDAAVESLATDGNTCVSTSGCEPQRFMAAYASLLELRNADLGGAPEDLPALAPPESDSPVLESVPE